jgi:hypothetical protein
MVAGIGQFQRIKEQETDGVTRVAVSGQYVPVSDAITEALEAELW